MNGEAPVIVSNFNEPVVIAVKKQVGYQVVVFTVA